MQLRLMHFRFQAIIYEQLHDGMIILSLFCYYLDLRLKTSHKHELVIIRIEYHLVNVKEQFFFLFYDIFSEIIRNELLSVMIVDIILTSAIRTLEFLEVIELIRKSKNNNVSLK